MLKALVRLAMMLSFTFLVACGGAANAPSPDASVPPTASPTEATRRPTATYVPRQLQAQLDGGGPDVLGPYEMGPGVIIAFVRYEGDAPFSLTFVDEDQGLVKSIDSRPGPYQGERVHSVFEGNDGGLAPGNYMVNVVATGPWRLRLFQERAIRGQTPEITLAGSGDGGGSWIHLDDGEYTMTTSHAGESDFTVELFDAKGVPPYQIVEIKGDHEGKFGFTVGGGAPGENPQAGAYAMGVVSQGDWSVTITSDDAP